MTPKGGPDHSRKGSERGCVNEVQAMRALGVESEDPVLLNDIPEMCCPWGFTGAVDKVHNVYRYII